MTKTARIFALALGLASLAAPAMAQTVCGPTPALPDTERRTEYAGIVSQTGPFNVGFQLYGDGTDYGNWVSVWVNGVALTPVTDFIVTSPTGTLATICRPISDAQVTFTAAQTGTIEIEGSRRPRRTSQFSENAGIPARSINQVLSDMAAQLRERWDRQSRIVRSPPGEALAVMPPAATRANKFLMFDSTGLIPQMAAGAGSGNVIGPLSSTAGNVAVFNSTTGTLLADGGSPVSTQTPGAYPGPDDPAVALGTVTGHTLAPLNANVVYNGNGVYPFQIDSTNPYVVGISGVIASSTVAQTFNITFTSTHLAVSPLTVGYTAVGGDTVSTIATRLCTAINANTNLNFNGTGLPLFCQANGGGQFNLQWNVLYSDLTAASVGTGSITGLSSVVRLLDYTRFIIGRRIPGYVGQAGDSISCLSIYGQSTSGAMDAVVGNFCGALQGVTAGNVTGELTISNSLNSAGIAEIGMKDGLIVYDSANAAPTGGYLGRGKINLPTTGAIRLGGTAGCGITQNELIACGNNIVGGLNPGSPLNLQSTDNGSPSGDFVQITTSNTVRQKWFSGGGVSVGGAADPGAPGIINLLTGIRIGNAAASGNVLRGNGTNFVSAQLAAADLSNGTSGSGAVCLVTSCNMVTPVLGVAAATSVTAANGTSNGFVLTAAAGTNGSLSMGAGGTEIFTLGSTLDAFAVNDHLGATIFQIVEATPGTLASSLLTFAGTAQATTTSSGSIQTLGGMGVAKDIVSGGSVYTSTATFMNRSKTTFTNNAAAAAGTLTNAPTAGNPTKWIGIDDNGTTRFIPAW